MKKWEKIENSINQLILKLISLFKSKISNLTPSKFKGYVKESKELLTHRRGELKERLVKGKEHALKKAVNAKGKIDQAKNKTLTVVQKAKTTNYKEIKLRKVFAILIAFIAPPFMKFKQWLQQNGYDWGDPKLSLGYIKIGQIDIKKTFGNSSVMDIHRIMNENLDIKFIKTVGEGAVEYTYPYTLDSNDWKQIQMEGLKRGYESRSVR